MIIIPPRHYCVVENPVLRNKDNEIVLDASSQVRLSHADLDMRLAQDPFPLWPGEGLKQPITALKFVSANSALRVMAILDFEDDSGDKRTAGDEWLFEGPGKIVV
jgi:major vault protein